MKKKVLSLALVLVLALLLVPAMASPVAAATGSGTEGDPYLIYTEADLKGMQTNGHYKLMNDIVLSELWTPKNFTGVFDGNMHTLYNVFVSKTESAVGFFGILENATVKNLSLENGIIQAEASCAGGIAGVANTSVIENCNVNLKIRSTTFFRDVALGGIVGYVSSGTIIRRCAFYGEVVFLRETHSSGTVAGGIAGWLGNPIYIAGELPANQNNCMIEQCANFGKVIGDIHYAGGIVGYADLNMSISNCYNRGDVITKNGYCASGIVAMVSTIGRDVSIRNCYSTGLILSKYQAASIMSWAGRSPTIELSACAAINSSIESSMAVARVLDHSLSAISLSNNLALNTMQTILNGVPVTSIGSAGNENGQDTTMAQFQNPGTYTAIGWDFDGIWEMGGIGGLPKLRMERSLPPRTPLGGTGSEVSRVLLCPGALTLQVGESATLNASVLPESAADKSLGFASSDTGIASVSSQGIVTGIAVGSASITATAGNGVVGSYSITVVAPVLPGMFIVLPVAGTAQLAATGNTAGNSAYTWASSNAAIAGVDANGLVTALAPGLCSITASAAGAAVYSMGISVTGGEPQAEYTIVNDDHPNIIYSGSWTHYNNNNALYMADEFYSGQAGAYAQFSFTGTAIRYIAAKQINHGICDIYIDGQLAAQGIDAYAPQLEGQLVLFEQTGLAPGQHSIRIVATGEKCEESSDPYITIDAFAYY